MEKELAITMEKELVIKVLYGGTLRRFSVLLNGNGSLDLDMAGLRTKIFNMFKFASDADHTLTYVDEDGEGVTLVDDADLHDAIKQRLNPLRIFVSLNSDSAKVLNLSESYPLRSVTTTSSTCIPLPPPAFTPMLPSPSAPMGFRPFTSCRSQVSRDLVSNASSSIKADPLEQQPLFSLSSIPAGTAPSAFTPALPSPSAPMGFRPFASSRSQVSRGVVSNASSSIKADPLQQQPLVTSSSMLTGTTRSAFTPVLPSPSVPMGFRPFASSRSQVFRDLASSASSIKADYLGQQSLFSSSSMDTAPKSYHDYITKLTDTTISMLPPIPMGILPYTPRRSHVSRDFSLKASSSIKADPVRQHQLFRPFPILAGTALESYPDYIPKLSDTVVSKAAEALGSDNQIGMASKKLYNDSDKSKDCETSDDLKAQKETLPVSELLSKLKDLTITHAPNSSRSVSTSDPQNAAKVDSLMDVSSPQSYCFDSGKIPQKEYNDFPIANPNTSCFSPSLATALPAHDLVETSGARQNNEWASRQTVQNASNMGPGIHTALPQHNLVKPAVAPQNIHSMSGQMGPSASITCPTWFMPPGRINGKGDAVGETFHRRVRCDGCGLHPIVGPRFTSKVKVDYDLCSVCYAALGNETEYTRLDHPSRLPKVSRRRVAKPLLLRNFRQRYGPKSLHQPKLNCYFIEDVNIVDGTIMAPLTPFTKIWRVHNNGAESWPRGTQLLWIGGDRLTNLTSVDLELPNEGCFAGMDLDVAIDFTAPEQPGHYVSYWRMAMPSGDKFGQCIWVLIQVDASLRDTQSESVQCLNLNLPPNGVDLKHEVIDVNVEPVDASPPNFHPIEFYRGLVKPVVNEDTSKEMEAMVDNLLSVHPEVPAVDLLSNVETSAFVPESAGATGGQTFFGGVSDGISLEQSLLKELEDMGFREIDLNREILRANQYDLDRSLDDLCSVPTWDPMLEVLQEMGFPDKETNRRLLIKNNGSIKRVVKDLIAAENA